jgi:hypothetical protein
MTDAPPRAAATAKPARKRLKLELFLFIGNADTATLVRPVRASQGGTITIALDVPFEGDRLCWHTYRITHDATGTRCTCPAGGRGRCEHIAALRHYLIIPKPTRRTRTP